MGLVERVTEPEALVDVARAYITELSEQVAPSAIADIKRLVYQEAGMEIDTALPHAVEATHNAVHTADAREGASAFVERRTPRFARLGSA
jgi:enoyl-CoA hydratase/carnithine racemase